MRGYITAILERGKTKIMRINKTNNNIIPDETYARMSVRKRREVFKPLEFLEIKETKPASDLEYRTVTSRQYSGVDLKCEKKKQLITNN